MKRIHKNMNYPPTDLVILAGGQARDHVGKGQRAEQIADDGDGDQRHAAPPPGDSVHGDLMAGL